MIFNYYNEIVNLISIIFAPEPKHNKQNIEVFQRYLMVLEDGFRVEISENLYNIIGYSDKEKLIKKYIINIAEWNYNLLNSKIYEDDEEENDHLAPEIYFIEIKNIFKEMINIICEECFTHSIDLIKISSESNYSKDYLNLNYYYDKMDLMNTNNELSNQKQFEKIFTSTKAYNFYCYLLENFNHSDLAKHSTIYFMMLNDKFIDITLRPERYKRLLYLSKFNIEITKSLKNLNSIGIKTRNKYDKLKQEFFEIK